MRDRLKERSLFGESFVGFGRGGMLWFCFVFGFGFFVVVFVRKEVRVRKYYLFRFFFCRLFLGL